MKQKKFGKPLALAAALCVLLAGCSQPEYYDTSQLKTSSPPTTQPEGEGGDGDNAAAHWSEVIEGGKAALSIDADILMPDSDNFAVLQVKDKPFAQEDADAAFSFLAQGKELHAAAGEDSGQGTVDNSEMIALYTRVLEEMSRGNNVVEGVTYDETPDEIARRLQELQAADGQPAEQQDQQGPPVLKFDEVEGDNKQLIAFVDLGREHRDRITVQSSNEGGYSRSGIGFESANTEDNGLLSDTSIPIGQSDGQPEGVSMTKEQAGEQAKAAADQLGAGLEIASVKRGFGWLWEQSKREGWVVRLRRSVEGVPLLKGREDGLRIVVNKDNAAQFGMEEMFSADQAASPADEGLSSLVVNGWDYEEMVVCLDDSGITYLNWVGRVDIDEAGGENVQLLGLDEVKQAVHDNVDSMYALDIMQEDSRVESVNVNISGMQLGLLRVPAGEQGQDQLISAWTLSGTAIAVYNKEATLAWLESEEDNEGMTAEERWDLYFSAEAMRSATREVQVQLAINAVDGSVIPSVV